MTPQTAQADKGARRSGRAAQSGEMQTIDKANKKLAFSSDAVPGGAPAGEREGRGAGRRGRGPRPNAPKEESSGMIEKVIRISRVAKVTKGGTKLSFTALVVVGDGKGKVGYALGKAAEVAVAIKKGMNAAKKELIDVPVDGTTIPHQVIGSWCATRVMLKPAAPGTGVIAAGPVRAICDGAGIKNILTKIHRSSNPMNVVRATFEGISQLKNKPVKAEEAKAATETK